MKGLQKITTVIDNRVDGFCVFTDGNELVIENYDGKRYLYHCGREYQKIHREKRNPLLLVVIDANNSAIGETDGENINVLWKKESLVPRKHKAGGQSQRRFERDRNRALKEWLRKVVDIVKEYCDNKKIIIGGCGMTKDVFIKELPMYIQEKIIDIRNVGYTDENGLWELIQKSRYE